MGSKAEILHMGPGLTCQVDPTNFMNDRLVLTSMFTEQANNAASIWALANKIAGSNHAIPPTGTVRAVSMDGQRTLVIQTLSPLIPGRQNECLRWRSRKRSVMGVPGSFHWCVDITYYVPQKSQLGATFGQWAGQIASLQGNVNNQSFHVMTDWPQGTLLFNGVEGSVRSIGITTSVGNPPPNETGDCRQAFSFTGDFAGWADLQPVAPSQVAFPALPT